MINKEIKIVLTGILSNRLYWEYDDLENRGFYIDDEKIDLQSILKDLEDQRIKITIETLE